MHHRRPLVPGLPEASVGHQSEDPPGEVPQAPTLTLTITPTPIRWGVKRETLAETSLSDQHGKRALCASRRR